jgi:serine/threonine protein kinase
MAAMAVPRHPARTVRNRRAVATGGMGEVDKARDTRLDRDVAVKVLPAALTGEAAARERFLREARAAASRQPADADLALAQQVKAELAKLP